MSENHEYPSLPEMGSNLAKFAFDLVKKSMRGDALMVSDEVAQERMEICKTCEYYDPEQTRCKHCGCFLEHKVKWALDSCPIEKWTQSDKDWMNGKFDEVFNHVKNNTEPTAPWHINQEDIPEFPSPETTPVGYVFVHKDSEWLFTGEAWIPYASELGVEKQLEQEKEFREQFHITREIDRS